MKNRGTGVPVQHKRPLFFLSTVAIDKRSESDKIKVDQNSEQLKVGNLKADICSNNLRIIPNRYQLLD